MVECLFTNLVVVGSSPIAVTIKQNISVTDIKFVNYLTVSWRRPLSSRNRLIDFQCKSIDWFLYDKGLHGFLCNLTTLHPSQIVKKKQKKRESWFISWPLSYCPKMIGRNKMNIRRKTYKCPHNLSEKFICYSGFR